MYWVYFKNLVKLAAAYATGKSFWIYRLYKQNHVDQKNTGTLKIAYEGPFAIVMQGPLIIDSSFTIETLKIYRNNFPDAKIILSTWRVPDDTLSILKDYDIQIIQNEKPENPGISNVNLQIVTSRAGVLAARGLGARYVLKTRTDQRIYHPNLETYLRSLLEAFPLLNGPSKQVSRLVAMSLGTFKYRLYGVSDMFLFGHIDDIVSYWNIPLDERRNTIDERNNAGHTWRQFSSWRVCEVYFCTEYLKGIGRDTIYSLRDSFQVFRDHFIVIDHAAIKLYWHKYTLNEDRYADFGFFDPQMSFNDWLILYQSLDKLTINEEILDQPIVTKRT